MLSLPYTSITAVVLAALLIYLSLGVIRLRRRHAIAVLDGGDKSLTYAIRAQANLAEYAPIWLIMYALLEAQGAGRALLAVLSVLFILGRSMHAFSLRVHEHKAHQGFRQTYRIRFWGMVLTLTAYGLVILALMWQVGRLWA